MQKYKSKPLIVEAFKLGYEPYPEWFTETLTHVEYDNLIENGYLGIQINVYGGTVRAKKGDYIIRTQHGDIRVMSQYAFTRTHDAI